MLEMLFLRVRSYTGYIWTVLHEQEKNGEKRRDFSKMQIKNTGKLQFLKLCAQETETNFFSFALYGCK